MDSNEILKEIPGFFRKYKGAKGNGQYELYCQEFAYSIIYGNLNAAHLDEILSLIGLSRLPDRLMLVETEENDVFRFYPEFSVFPRRFNMTQVLQDCVARSGIEGMVASFQARGVIGVFLCTGQSLRAEEAKADQKLRKLATEMIHELNTALGENVSIGVSQFCGRLPRFPQAYAECKEALFHSFRLGKNKVCFFKDICEPAQPFDRRQVNAMIDEMVFAVTREDEKTAVHQSALLMEYMLSVAVSPINIRLFMVSIADLFISRFYGRRIADETLEKYYLQISKKIINSVFASDIEEEFGQLCRDLIRELRADTQTKEEQLLRKIDETIEKYYLNSELKLDVVAAIFHYSPYHFGRLFSALHGQSFRQYLAAYRVEKAKELLQKGGRPNEVAYQTGFNSVSYFCTVFKSVTGMSPMQYQEAYKQ